MKSFLIFTSTFLIFTFSGFSQDDEDLEFIPELKTGDAVISVNIGYPNWGRFNTENRLDFTGISGLSTKGFAPLGISAEYFLSKDFSLTATGFINSYGATWNQIQTIYNGTSFEDVTQVFEYDLTRIRLLFGINYHFYDIEIDRFDFFGGLAIGINSIRVNQTSTDPFFDVEDNYNFFAVEGDNLNFPIAYRANLGFRYIFKNNITTGLELSVGGPSLGFTLGYRL